MNGDAILGAIRGVIRGELGVVRVVTPDLFGEGLAAGVDRALGDQARWLRSQSKRTFDVEISPPRDTGALAGNGTKVLLSVDVRVTLNYSVSLLRDNANAEHRFTVRAGAVDQAHDVLAALTWPGNLSVDTGGAPTALISACLRTAGAPRIAREEWVTGILELELPFVGLVLEERPIS